ncbi:MAG: sigma-70 family RNA polymerase sigma factor [Gammaproteobacteria bacterium]|nr:sigma-70 family RNA polymerase sigma factor [Gammaproteobacteria bacterium]
MSLTDEQLLLEIQQGDRDAFATLVNRHSKKYYRFAYLYLNSKQEAEDIVQTAFLKLWAEPGKWQTNREVKFNTWFYRVIINLALDRNKKKMPELLGWLWRDKEVDDDAQAVAQDITRAIDKLPKRQKLALTLCFYQGYTKAEAAKIMAITQSAVEALNMRAKRSLAKILLKDDGN